VAIVAGCAWLFTLGLSLFILPKGNHALKSALMEMAQSRAQLGLKERVFNNQFNDLVFYVNRISSDGRRLHEIFISDERSPKTKRTIVADEGQILTDTASKLLTIRLFNGTILRVGDEMRSTQTVRFQNYDFRVDLASMFRTRTRSHKGRGELSTAELRQALAMKKPGSKEHNELLLEWHYRISLPFACIVLGFLAAPLGVQSGTGSRLSGVCLGLCLFLLYYVFHSAAQAFGEDGNYPPAVGKWLPNVVFGILAVVMWIKTARESPFKLISIFRRIGESVLSKLRGRQRCDLP
jgi:lipopolysaccharide export system permease protein